MDDKFEDVLYYADVPQLPEEDLRRLVQNHTKADASSLWSRVQLEKAAESILDDINQGMKLQSLVLLFKVPLSRF